jgi:L-ascorbate metabolism protein UlaG (beta-lactamase superfamily)
MDELTFIGNATTLIRLGSFTLLTDPNFLHRGQRAYLGYGLITKRLADPALRPDELPPLDTVVLSHLHGDHFDRVARRHLDRSPLVLTTPPASRRLRSWGFMTHGLDTWQRHALRKESETLTIEALPGIHATGALRRLLPPVMGSLIEHAVDGQVTRRVYLSGDTLPGDHIDEVRRRHPDIDVAVVHLGGTRVLFRTVTMDAGMGVDFVRRCAPRAVVPVHYDDYSRMKSPLSDFLDRAREEGLEARVVTPGRGETIPLSTSSADGA